MNKEEFKIILQEGEGQFIEFKERIDKKITQELVGFANASGGRIFIGVTDKNEVKGVEITNELKSQIYDLARNCDPSIPINLNSYDDVLIVDVKEGDNKPYSCKDGFFMRFGANTQKMKRDEIIKLSIKSGKIRFDEQICEPFDWKDFDDDKFNTFLKLSKISNTIGKKELLKNLKILTDKGMTNAGVLFFAKEPYKYISNSKLRCVRFKGDERINILDKKEVDKGIIGNIEFAIKYLNECVPVKYEIKGMKRIEYPQFPEEAYREAVVNAIVHRDYSENGEVAVEKLKDKIIINNPGASLVPKEEFGKESRLRNRLIGDLLSRTYLMERVGTGINRIISSCKKNKNSVKFESSDRNFFVTFQVGEKVGEKVGERLTENQLKILKYIKDDNFISAKRLSELIGISQRKIEENIAKLKNKGKLKRIGPAKGGHWEIIE
ncbi:transcriptional regulator [Candidatus Woesearchaeota archaeon]|nr:MAG: transcriptional regulator [Candidatus Woesearchaeota archaeon]